MTEQNAHPQGEPYGLAMALLHQATALPAAVVIHPDNVLWPFTSDTLSLQHFQLLEPAAAVLSALRARQISVALVIPASSAELIQQCLEEANLLARFKTVVHYQEADDQQQQQQPGQQQQQQQPGQQPVSIASTRSNWAAAANTLKAEVGAPWSQMLFFSADLLAIRQANKLGMASVRVPVTSGLSAGELGTGLEVFSSKIESDRGY